MVVADVEEEDEDVEVDSSDDKKRLGEIFTVVTWLTGINNGDVTRTAGDVDGSWVFSGLFGDVARRLCDVDCSFESVSVLVVFCEGVETLFSSGWYFFADCVGCCEICGFLL